MVQKAAGAYAPAASGSYTCWGCMWVCCSSPQCGLELKIAKCVLCRSAAPKAEQLLGAMSCFELSSRPSWLDDPFEMMITLQDPLPPPWHA